MSALLPALWLGVAAAATWTGRTPARLDSLHPGRPITWHPFGTPTRRVLRRLVPTIASRLDPASDRRRGRLVLAIGVVAAIAPPLAALLAAASLIAVWWRRRRAIATAVAARAEAITELIDTLRLAVSAGLTLPLAIPVAAVWGPPELRADLAEVRRRIDTGTTVEDALVVLGDAGTGATVSAEAMLVAGLVDHLRYGTPLLPTLDRLADEARRAHRHRGEARIRRLPVSLLFPLVFCTLPAFGLLTVGPILAGSLLSLVDGGLGASAPVTP